MGDIAWYYSKDDINDEEFRDEFKNFQEPLNPKPIIHTCKDGRKVCLNYHNPYGQDIPKMEDSHLLNTLKFLERRAKEGVIVKMGGGSTAEDIWYDEDVLYGKDAKKFLNYKKYKQEAKNRKLI